MVFWPLNLLAISTIIMSIAGLIQVSWIYLIVGWVLIAGLGVSVALHRVFTHRTHTPKTWLKLVLLTCATLACDGTSILWCALHRGSHHPHADTEKDPQRPRLKEGLLYTLHGWKNEIPKYLQLKSVPDLLRDPHHQMFHRHYVKIILGIWLIALLISPQFFLFGIIVPTFLSVWSNNFENVLSHIPKLGYRNHDTRDKSTNVWWLLPFGWGAGNLHNNHHASPAKYLFSEKWFEIDPAIIFIPLLKLGSK